MDRMSNTIEKKYKKRKGDDKHSNLDYIPDDIIVDILSLLPLKEAVATSVLSSRWRYLWRFTRMSLNFDVDYVTPKYGTLTCFKQVTEYLNKKRKSYIRWVNKVVDQHSGAIESLRVCYYLRTSPRHTKHIDRWVMFALRSNILEKLELDFSEIYPLIGISGEYSFFPNFFRVKYVGFKSLKVISLRHMNVSGEEAEYLLSNATLLERLTLRECQNLIHLRVSGQSLALKHLEIFAECGDLESVEICDLLNLVSFYFYGDFKNYADNFILRNLPLLVDFHIDFTDVPLNFKDLFSCWLPQIEFLRMTTADPCNMKYKHHEYPILPNVKQVHLRIIQWCGLVTCRRFRNLRLIIEAFPNLERLELHVPTYFYSYDITCRDWPEEVPNCPHSRLKEVEIFHYSSELGDMDRVLYLIKHAVALEKIIVNCKYDQHLRRMKTKQQIFEAEQISTTHAMTQLKPRIPSHIEFICR